MEDRYGMSQLYDITLKKIIKNIPKRFLKLLTVFEEGKFLDTKFPVVQSREPDLVIELPDTSIFHMELQATNEKDMEWRMHDYYSLIYQVRRVPIHQLLLYVGEAPLTMNNGIYHNTLTYSYKIKDIREIDCIELLSSNNPDDALLSILCRMENPIATLKAIRERFMVLPEKLQKDYVIALRNLSRLRGISPLVAQEVERKMPVIIDISKDEVYLTGRQEGRKEGRKEGQKAGHKEGRKEGLHEGLIIGIKCALDIKFGKSSLSVINKITEIQDFNRLVKIQESIKKASNITEFKKITGII